MTSFKQAKNSAIIAYTLEALLAVGVVFLLWWWDLLLKCVASVEQTAGPWATFFGVMLAGAMAARLVLFNLNSGDFSSWLEWKKVGGIYSAVFLFNLLLFLLVTVLNVFLISIKGTWLSFGAVFGIIFGLINSLSFPVFVYHLCRLQAKFNFEFKREIEREKQDSK